MRRMHQSIVAVALVAIVALAFGTGSGAPVHAAEPVKIAILGPFTGGAASVGQEQLNFAKLALADFKKSSGMADVELVEVDTQLDAAKAVTGAQSVISNDAVVGVVGPAGSQEVEAVSPLFAPANLVFISPSATRISLTEKGVKTFFRVVPRDDLQGATDANFMVKTLGAKLVYMIDDQTSYSSGLVDEVAKTLTTLGVKFMRESIKQGDTDFSSLVTKIKGAGADVVFTPFQIASQSVGIARQMKEQGLTAKLMGADGLFSPDDFIKAAAGATEGAYLSFFALDIHVVASSKEIVAAYEKQYGSFGSFGGPSYAATMVLLEAVGRASKAGGATRATVLAEVAKTDQKTSVLGFPIKFNDKGDVIGTSFYMYQVKGGNFVPVPGASEPAMAGTMSATMAATMSATMSATMAATAAK